MDDYIQGRLDEWEHGVGWSARMSEEHEVTVRFCVFPLGVNLVDGCDGIESSILSFGNGGSNPPTLKLQECSIVWFNALA